MAALIWALSSGTAERKMRLPFKKKSRPSIQNSRKPNRSSQAVSTTCPVASSNERLERKHVRRRVQVPELVGLPVAVNWKRPSTRSSAVKALAREAGHVAACLRDRGAKGVDFAELADRSKGGIERDLSLADRRIDPHVVNSLTAREFRPDRRRRTGRDGAQYPSPAGPRPYQYTTA